MLTLVTGTPGSGKSLYTVWEIARHIPGSTIESDGESVPRRLFSNIKNLLLDHQHITAEDLETWHTWAKPGDVIIFDEVQEVWRPRGLGAKVPEAIAKLETHRHMGVDLVLITQHPMLVDPNIRRLVNQHLHMRRITKTVAIQYEWDHCANPGQVRTSIQSKVWFHPKKAYSLYKSAQLHTKPTNRVPRAAYALVLVLAALGVVVPMAYGRIQSTFDGGKLTQAKPRPAAEPVHESPGVVPVPQASAAAVPGRADIPASDPKPEKPDLAGCVASADLCQCFTGSGQRVESDPVMCLSFDRPPPLRFDDLPGSLPPRQSNPDDLEVLAFIAKQRASARLYRPDAR